jgi:hypothetical protein
LRSRLIKGSGTMREYRVYIVGSDGHFSNVFPLDCADDGEAMEQAKQLVDGDDVELWQRDRKVATLNASRKQVSK